MCPIHSGSNRILKLMNRKYNIYRFFDVYNKNSQTNPQVEWSTQIIVGLPTETEENLNATLNIVQEVGFKDAVIFHYHEKENTISSLLQTEIS